MKVWHWATQLYKKTINFWWDMISLLFCFTNIIASQNDLLYLSIIQLAVPQRYTIQVYLFICQNCEPRYFDHWTSSLVFLLSQFFLKCRMLVDEFCCIPNNTVSVTDVVLFLRIFFQTSWQCILAQATYQYLGYSWLFALQSFIFWKLS